MGIESDGVKDLVNQYLNFYEIHQSQVDQAEKLSEELKTIYNNQLKLIRQTEDKLFDLGYKDQFSELPESFAVEKDNYVYIIQQSYAGSKRISVKSKLDKLQSVLDKSDKTL